MLSNTGSELQRQRSFLSHDEASAPAGEPPQYYVIQKGIPMPNPRNKRRSAQVTTRIRALITMEVEDCITFVRKVDYGGFTYARSQVQKATPEKTFAMEDVEGSPKKDLLCRIWRTK